MHLLLTKSLDKDILSILGTDILVENIDVIATKNKDFNLDELANHSLIFTSLNAVKCFFQNPISEKLKQSQKIYCVGNQSEKYLNSKDFQVVRVEKNAEDLSAYIIQNYNHEYFLHFCGNLALETIGKTLATHNIPYHKIIIYTTELLFPKTEKQYDAIAFFSPSGVRSFVKHNNLDTAKLFSIGETTTNEIKKWTNNPVKTSPKNTTDDLLKLIRQYASAKH